MSQLGIERTEVTIQDLENIASVLESTLTLVQARDLETAALHMSPPITSALAVEAQRQLGRIEGLLEGYYAEIGRQQANEALTETEESLTELSSAPLGAPRVVRAERPWDFPAQRVVEADSATRDKMFLEGSAAVEEDE